MKNDLIGKKFKVLDKGFVQLIDYMGSDKRIVDAARVSYGKGTKTVSEDEGLIRYLMRHRHTTPFEQCEISFRVKVPMDCWRQWIRHRTASVNEYSTRYSEAIDEKQETLAGEWRLQEKINKQGSRGYLINWPKGLTNVVYREAKERGLTVGQFLTEEERRLHEEAEDVYEERLELGVAREQARKDLPLSTYTLAYWKINLHNLLHFLSLRMDSHAQLEIRSYANVIGNEIVAKLFPLTWGAFQDYRLNAITLTARDIEMIYDLIGEDILDSELDALQIIESNKFNWFNKKEDGSLKNNRERQEFEEKAKNLGVIVPWI